MPVNQVLNTPLKFSTNALNSECTIEENTKYSGHNLYSRKGIKGGNQKDCAALCFKDSKCKFWTYNPRSTSAVHMNIATNNFNKSTGLRNVG